MLIIIPLVAVIKRLLEHIPRDVPGLSITKYTLFFTLGHQFRPCFKTNFDLYREYGLIVRLRLEASPSPTSQMITFGFNHQSS